MKTTPDHKRFRDPSTEKRKGKKKRVMFDYTAQLLPGKNVLDTKGFLHLAEKSIMRTGDWKLKSEIQNGHDFSSSDGD